MSSWTDVATLDDLWEGDILEVTIGSDVILLAHLPGGAVHAYQGICPHNEFPLATGELDDDVLTCAGHGWEFNLSTGQGVNPASCQLPAVPVPGPGKRGQDLRLGADRRPAALQPLPRVTKRGAQRMADELKQLVGPVVRGFDPDIVEALRTAIEKDNPGAPILVEDHAGYVRIHAPRYLRVTRASLEEAAGRAFPLAALEPAIASFAGRMNYVGDDELVWYLTREDSQ